MTECERLLAQGLVPRDFLCDEERNGYLVSAQMKKVWAISIDLFHELKRVCHKYNLSFFSIGGTAIGAVRHKGFIPWDDDLDFAMPRADYDKLLEVAKSEFKEPYFLQSPTTDRFFFNRFFVRLRNSFTTGISPYDKKIGCNNGIFIDIFPLDDYKDSVSCFLFFKLSHLQAITAWNKLHYKYINKNKCIRWLLYKLAPFIIGNNLSSMYEKHENRCRQICAKNCACWGIMYESFIGNHHRWIWPKKSFESTKWFPFEYTEVPLPSGYDEILRISFGEYLKFPPKETWGKHHNIEFQPDIPYVEYC